jgi:hypothetical protein
MFFKTDNKTDYINPDAYVLTNRKWVGDIDDKVKIEILINIITKAVGIDRDVLFTKSRKRHLSDTRHLLAFLIKRETELSLANIGKIINRDHATVLNSVKVWNNLLETDKNYRIRTRTIADKYMQKVWEVEKDKTLILEEEDVIANWELVKDKKDKKGNYLYK